MKKAVLITGACINTGVAIVEEFARNGHSIVFTGRNSDAVKECEARYRASFPDVEIIGCSLEALTDGAVNESGVRALFEELDTRGIFISDVILNAADQGLSMQIFESPITDFLRVMNTNVTWNYCIVENAARRMKEKGGGSVVFINSNTAYRAIPDRLAYVASKGAQLSLMRGLALDLGKYGIRVNAVLPGMIRTDRWEKNPEFYKKVPSRFTPIGDVAEGRDIAEAAYYFACHARNTTGAELVVDGGNTIQLYPILPKDGEEG